MEAFPKMLLGAEEKSQDQEQCELNQEKESYQENQALIKTVFTNRNLKTYYQTNYMEGHRQEVLLVWVQSDPQASEVLQATLTKTQGQWAAQEEVYPM